MTSTQMKRLSSFDELTIPTYDTEIEELLPEELGRKPNLNPFFRPTQKAPKSPLDKCLFTDQHLKSIDKFTLEVKKSPDIYVAKVSRLVLEYLEIVKTEDTPFELNPQPLQKTHSQDFKDVFSKDNFQISSIKHDKDFHSRTRSLISSLCISILNAEVLWQELNGLQKNLIALVQTMKEKADTSQSTFDLEKLIRKDFGIGFMITSKRPRNPEFTDPQQSASDRSSMISDLKKMLKL